MHNVFFGMKLVARGGAGWLAACFMLAIGTPAFAGPLCAEGTLAWTETRLFFGRDIGDGGEVTDEGWRDFTIEEIIPKFSKGFTIIDGAGYWQGESCQAGNVALEGGCEKTKILMIQYAPSLEAETKLQAIAQAYIKRFDQEAVMRSDAPVCTQFITPAKP